MVEVQKVNGDRHARVTGRCGEKSIPHKDLQSVLTLARNDIEFLEVYGLDELGSTGRKK